LVSAFTHEIGQVFAVIAGAALGLSAWRAGRRARAVAVFFLFASILPIYQGFNLIDYLTHPYAYDENSTTTIWERLLSAHTIKNTVRYTVYTIIQPFFPSLAALCYFNDYDRLHIPEVKNVPLQFLFGSTALIVSLGVMGALVVLTLRCLPRFVRTWDRVGRLM